MKPSDNQVVELYCEQGLSIAKTAEALKMSTGFVRKALKRSGKNTRSISEGARKWRGTDKITDEEIIGLHNRGWSCEKISKHFNKSEDFARQRLIALDIERRSITFYNKERSLLNSKEIKELIEYYQASFSLEDIKAIFGIKSDQSIYDILHKNNISLRGKSGNLNPSFKDIDYYRIVELYCCENNDAYQIAKKMNISETTVYNLLKMNGIKRRKTKGANSNLWKGGITPLHVRIRTCAKYHCWRRNIFKRDNYTCQWTNKRGGELHVHHKTRFSKIFQDFLLTYKDLDPIIDVERLFELSQAYGPFWDLFNGITVSEEIHKKLHGDIK